MNQKEDLPFYGAGSFQFVTSFSLTGGTYMLADFSSIVLNAVLLAYFAIGVLFLYSESKFLRKMKTRRNR